MTERFLPRAITLDLDDTLWPVGPTLVTAERALADWFAAEVSAREVGCAEPDGGIFREACRRAADRAAPPYSSPHCASARWA